MDWFEELFGFRETDGESVRDKLEVSGCDLRSRVNGASYKIGRLETPTLGELRERVSGTEKPGPRPIAVRNVEGDAGKLHADAGNAGAFFQVASQFNLLEMIGPDVTPEKGVTGYACDRTQGPACAIAAGAGTVYRNYFAPVGEQLGQTSGRQIDCLHDVHAALSPDGAALWEMRNGYALCSKEGLSQINDRLSALDEPGRDAIRSRLRIGLHWDVQVTKPTPAHCVSQAYCSALPVGYSQVSSSAWEAFARLVLEASYEACLLAAFENACRHAKATVYLTKLGDGVFRNETDWIQDAMRRAFELTADTGLDVRIVHYRQIDRHFLPLEQT